jgi:serine/threonine protein phosphatase PrpC
MDPDFFVHLFGQTDIGNHRQTNEDAWWAGQLGGLSASAEMPGETLRFRCMAAPVLAIVSDGVGGSNAGEVASQMAVSCIPAFLASRQTALSVASSAGDTLCASLQAADAAIKTKATQPGMSGMCTTVSLLCLVGNGFAWWGQAGDSRIYRYRRGQLEQITRDHSPVGRMRQDGCITEEAARRHPQRNQIDQSLGDQLNPFAPDVGSIKFQPLDVYLLCSDGLSDGLWDGEIAQIVARVRGGTDVRPAAEHLVAAAKRTSGRDNITVVVVFVEAPAANP